MLFMILTLCVKYNFVGNVGFLFQLNICYNSYPWSGRIYMRRTYIMMTSKKVLDQYKWQTKFYIVISLL